MSETPPAGWYPDPQDASQQRYWDGTVWTEHTAPAAQQASPQQFAAGPSGGGGGAAPDPWLWQSIVATLLCCLPAGIVGIVFASKSQTAAGAGNMVEASKHADTARTWTLVSVGIGVVTVAGFLILGLVGGFAGY